MRIIVFLLALFISQQVEAQIGGSIRGKTRSGGTPKEVGIDSLTPNRYALSTTDSLLRVLTGQHKTIDSVSQNILVQMYELWRNSLSNPVDNKVGTRDTTLQEVYSSGKLKVQDDSSFSRSTVKVSGALNVDSLSIVVNRLDSILQVNRNNLAANQTLNSYYGEMAVPDDAATATKYLSVYDKYADFYRQIISDRAIATVIELETNVSPNIDSVQRNTDSLNHKLNQIITKLSDSVKVWTTGGFGGGGGSAGATTIYDSTITRVSMTVTNLNSLANSAAIGWGSDSVTNYRKATDYRINVTLTMANTAPANDRAAYVYIVPLYNNNGTFETSMQGTTTAPSLTQGATTIATPNNLRLLGVLSYTTQNMILRDTWSLSEIFPVMPDGFKIIIINFTGAAVAASGNQVNYTPIFKTQR